MSKKKRKIICVLRIKIICNIYSHPLVQCILLLIQTTHSIPLSVSFVWILSYSVIPGNELIDISTRFFFKIFLLNFPCRQEKFSPTISISKMATLLVSLSFTENFSNKTNYLTIVFLKLSF